MGLLDFIIRKRQEQNKTNTKSRILPKIATNDEEANVILEEEIKNFFPKEGVWYDNCFSRPREVWSVNLPCHLRDNAWMSQLLHKVLKDKRIYIKPHTIKQFMDNSETFAELRHEYELKIVEWQIDWVMMGGTNWLPPNGSDEFSLIFSEDYDKIVRDGIVKTLKAIGMDAEVVEEGLVSDIFAHPQSDVTKDILSNLTNVKTSMVRWSEDGGHYTLRFRGNKTGEPIISKVTKEVGAVFNIRAAGVQRVNDEELGVMVTDIGPDKDIAKKSVELLRELGVIVEETKEAN